MREFGNHLEVVNWIACYTKYHYYYYYYIQLVYSNFEDSDY